MSRTIWKGAISFSLIHIPVTLQAASRSNTLDLDLLDKRDFAPVGYQRFNKSTGKVVEWGDIVKGYQYSDGEYVVLTDEDFRQANVEATQTIDIQGFTQLAAIGPEYFDTPYHLLPDARGDKVYELLHEALSRSGSVAIGLIVIRTRQYVSAILPRGNRLLLNTLRYADEIVEPEAPRSRGNRAVVARGKSGVSPRETSMALKLVEEMTQSWDAATFHDTYREDLLKRVEQKVKAGKTKQLTAPEKAAAPRATNVVDLTELLRQSLATRKGAERAPARQRRQPARGTARRRRA